MPYKMWLARIRYMATTLIKDFPCVHCGTCFQTQRSTGAHQKACKKRRELHGIPLFQGRFETCLEDALLPKRFLDEHV